MARETPPESDSESERVPSKRQKKREESPTNDPMNEDGEDNEEAEGDDGEEYEIEIILDSSVEVFPDGEKGYLVKWKGYPDSENSWVRESDAPNADELISKFMDKRAKEKAAEKKKASAKSRKSSDHQQEHKKRGRISTKSRADSDEDEPEVSPVRPVSKKQKKAPAPIKNKADHEKDELDMNQFVSMDKYMHLDSWNDLVGKIETIEKDDEGTLYIYGILTTGDNFRLPSTVCNPKFPQKIIAFYENNLRWRPVDETS